MNFAGSEQRQKSGVCYFSQLVMTGNERYIQEEIQSISLLVLVACTSPSRDEPSWIMRIISFSCNRH